MHAGVHNKTAENITNPPLVLPSRPTLKHILNPRVGDKLLETDNRFQQDLLIGSELVHQSNDDYLLIGPKFFYRKNVRKEVPPMISGARCGVDSAARPAGMYQRGMRRWTALPDIVEVSIIISVC